MIQFEKVSSLIKQRHDLIRARDRINQQINALNHKIRVQTELNKTQQRKLI